MLVMRRRAGECILIGPDIQLEILEVSPTRVKLGISAPSSMQIVRREVALTRDENLTAARTDPQQAIGWLQRRLNGLATSAAPAPAEASPNPDIEVAPESKP